MITHGKFLLVITPLFLSAGLGLGACAAAPDEATRAGELPLTKEGEEPTLYIGDFTDNSVKRFNGATGAFEKTATESDIGLHGPNGIVLNSDGDLLVSNQNLNVPLLGELLLFNPDTGKLIKRIVSHDDEHAPYGPDGIILWEDDTIFIADPSAGPSDSEPITPGRVRAFSTSGEFLKDLIPPPALHEKFHPRGVVIGPDNLLYVSIAFGLPPSIGGQVLRFDPETMDFLDVFVDDAGGVGHLNRPDGLVFGPDGNLYITSFRAPDQDDSGTFLDTDKIRIYQGPGRARHGQFVSESPGQFVSESPGQFVSESPGQFVSEIDLYTTDQPRAFAQALLFGPGGDLFVPISGGGPDAGSVRRYNVSDKSFSVFVPPAAQGGPLIRPQYLTFDETDPATLVYHGEDSDQQ